MERKRWESEYGQEATEGWKADRRNKGDREIQRKRYDGIERWRGTEKGRWRDIEIGGKDRQKDREKRKKRNRGKYIIQKKRDSGIERQRVKDGREMQRKRYK